MLGCGFAWRFALVRFSLICSFCAVGWICGFWFWLPIRLLCSSCFNCLAVVGVVVAVLLLVCRLLFWVVCYFVLPVIVASDCLFWFGLGASCCGLLFLWCLCCWVCLVVVLLWFGFEFVAALLVFARCLMRCWFV